MQCFCFLSQGRSKISIVMNKFPGIWCSSPLPKTVFSWHLKRHYTCSSFNFIYTHTHIHIKSALNIHLHFFIPFLCASGSPIITKPRCIHKYARFMLVSLLTRGEYSNWKEPCSPVLCMDAWLQCCILPVSNVLCHLLPMPSKAISSTKDIASLFTHLGVLFYLAAHW